MTQHLQRAFLLFEQSRFDLAEEELHKHLAADPNSAEAHAILGLCLAGRKKYNDATREAREAVGLAPDTPFPYYALAHILSDRNHLKEAEDAIHQAINLDPEYADYYAVLGSIKYQRKEWQAALSAAEEGLHFDAENVGCNNLRAMALVKLGRRQEAGETIDAALARDPDNAVSHANRGWTLLEQGKTKEAMEHFREALRLQPDLEWARHGIVEALKARNIIYRLFLMYFMWMSRLSAGVQWAIIIGGYFAFRYLRRLADANPDLAPFIWPFLILYMLFALMTWIADPMFNLLLRLNRFGRYALSREQIVASNWVGACVGLALLSLMIAGGLFLAQLAGHNDERLANAQLLALLSAAMFGLLVIPLAGTFNCESGWPRQVMAGYTSVLALLGIGGLTLLALGNDLGFVVGTLFLLGAVLSGFIANALMMASVKR